MIDESFHLTPLDVRRYDFGRAFRGYNPARVDQFRDQVAEEMERLTRISQDLDSKARSFHEQLRAFRERDKALNDALIAAQQLRGEVREQSEREAQLILREAQAEGERIIEAAKSDVRRMEEELDNLDRSRRTYLAQMRTLIARQLSEVEASDSQVVASTLRGAGSNSSASTRERRQSAPCRPRRGETRRAEASACCQPIARPTNSKRKCF